jgi:hypothetical protein
MRTGNINQNNRYPRRARGLSSIQVLRTGLPRTRIACWKLGATLSTVTERNITDNDNGERSKGTKKLQSRKQPQSKAGMNAGKANFEKLSELFNKDAQQQRVECGIRVLAAREQGRPPAGSTAASVSRKQEAK